MLRGLFLASKNRYRLTRNRDNRATPDAKTEERYDFPHRGDSEQGNGVESEQYIFGGQNK